MFPSCINCSVEIFLLNVFLLLTTPIACILWVNINLTELGHHRYGECQWIILPPDPLGIVSSVRAIWAFTIVAT